MKKYISLCLSVILLAGLLSGCLTQNGEEQPTTTMLAVINPTHSAATAPGSTNQTLPAETATDLSAQVNWNALYLGLTKDSVSEVRFPVVIKSVEELEELVQGKLNAVYGITSAVRGYDDAFFAEHTLILTCEYAYSGREHFAVKSCQEIQSSSGYSHYIIHLTVAEEQGFGTGMWEWDLYFIEVASDLPKNAIVYIYPPEEPPYDTYS